MSHGAEGSLVRLLLVAAATYFFLVFCAGFVLGIVRVVWLVPTLGTRWAELIEIPLMLGVIVLAADWVVRRFDVRGRPGMVRAGVGSLALALLLAAEFTVVLRLRGLSLSEYFASRDPVSGAAYLFSLILFAAMPAIVGHTPGCRRRKGGAGSA